MMDSETCYPISRRNAITMNNRHRIQEEEMITKITDHTFDSIFDT